MKTIKRLVAIALAVLMIFGSVSVAATAWDVNTDDGKSLSITTKIFRLVDGEWTETEKVKQGEEVRARIYLNTDYYTNSGNLLFFYNNDFFTDSFGADSQAITVSSYYAASPYSITGNFAGELSSGVENSMLGYGKITSDFAEKHSFVYITYKFGGKTNQKISDSQWLFEIPLTVKTDAAAGTGTGDFFAVEETTRSTSFKQGRINVPKGPYDGNNTTITAMSDWDAELTYTSNPVTLYATPVSATFDAGLGVFADKTTTYYVEGDAGDALTVPSPTRTNFAFKGWKVKGADDSTAAEITKFPATVTEYVAVWESTTQSDETLDFITKIYRQDAETGEWIETDRVKPGEKVKARLFVNTSYFTNAGNIIVFYDKDFFTDAYEYDVKNDNLLVNDDPESSAAINGVSGDFAKLSTTNTRIANLVNYGYISQDFADTHEAITIRYQFNPSTSKKIDGDKWFVEFDLQVLDTASGEGDFFVVEDTIMNSGDGNRAYINLPRGEEGGTKEETTSMYLWDVNATVKSYPVRIDSTLTLDANGGAFADGSTSYPINGVIGSAVDYTAVPEITKEGFTFKGWAPASIENPTEADVVELPAEMPYDDTSYKAVWTAEVTLTYVLNNDEADIVKVVTSGDPLEAPADPSYEGNLFIGWTTDPTFVKLTGLPANNPTEDTTYYAVFESMVYRVNYYVLNTETKRFDFVTEGLVTYGDVISKVPASYVVPEGYTLSAPYTDVTLTTELADGATMPANTVNLYYSLSEGTYDAVFMVDGVEYARIPTVYDTFVEAPEDPDKEGYTFTGWEPYVGLMDEEGKTYVATWEVNEYTATYMVDGAEYEAFSVAYEADMESPADPDKEGYTFIGWAKTADATEAEELPATMPAEDTTYYAIFDANEYTLTFVGEDDAPIATLTQDYGTAVEAPVAPEKVGYTFAGWVDVEGNPATVHATMPAKDEAFKASYTINQYKVTWVYADGITNDKVETLDYNADIVAPEEPTREGYTFNSWTPAVDAKVPAYDVTYTATWDINSYDAIFEADGGVYADGSDSKTESFEYGAQIVAPEEPTKQGYVFAGWDNELGVMGTEAVTFTAEWDAATDTPYKVNYYTMTTAGAYDETAPVVDNRTGTTGETATAVTNVTEGFYVDTDKSVLSGTIAADGTTTLSVYYARNLYTVTFDANEGVLTGNASADYYHGATVAVPTATKEGYTFIGWDKNVSTVAVADADYVAQWDANEYTITFNTDGGTAIDPIKADYLSDVNAPAAVTTKEGYTFGGWAETQGETDSAKAVTFPVQMPLDGDTYYAIWTPNKYTITFNTDGGNEIAPITQDYATAVTAPADPTKTGYTFNKWDVEVPATMPAGDMTITALWTVNKYDITWNDGVTETTEKVEYNSEILVPVTEPTKTGYTFTGWADADGKTPADYGTVPAGDVTFNAQWDINEYTVSFDTDDGTIIAPITQDYQSAITAPDDPEKVGYTFAGWVDSEGNPATVPATMPAADLALKATWDANTDTAYKVVVNYTNFNSGAAETAEFEFFGTTDNSIEIVEAYPEQAAEKTEYVILSDVAVANYELDKAAANEFTGVVAADGSTILNLYYVPVKRVATFDAAGGNWDGDTANKTVEASHGSLVKPIAPEDPVREGYTFDGWNGLTDATKLTANRTFTAAWVANKYTITYNFNNGSDAQVDTYDYNGLINKPVNPTKEGYTFKAWEPSIPDNMPAENVVINATWNINSYDIVWNVDGTETTETLEFGTKLYEPKDPVKEGYTFTGWADAEGKTPADYATVPADDVTFTAQWAVNPYNVSYFVYEPATGKFASAGTATVDFGAAIPATVPSTYVVPAGYALNAQAYTDIALATALAADATMPAKDVALYYTLTAETFNAIFNVDGALYETVPTVFGEEIKEPTAPTKEGYTFTGWSPEVGVMDSVDGKSYEAQWAVNSYNAIFKANGGLFADGETTNTVATDFGATIVVPDEPTKTGYTFAGWETVPATMPANDVTITAKWTIDKYTITFNTDGGSAVDPITQDYGSAVAAPAAPTKTGYSFAGWEGLPTTMPAADTTVKALWTKNSYTVTWNIDGVKSTEIYAFGDAIVKPADPTKEGHTFKAWTPAVDATMPAYNVEYVATWNTSIYTATFDANGGKFADNSTTKTQKFEFGAAVTAPEIPTNTGYNFAGWEPALSTMPAANTTYKAVWSAGDAKAYTINVYTMDTEGNYGDPVAETKTANIGEIVKVTATPGEGFYIDTNENNVLEGTIVPESTTVLSVYYARYAYEIKFNGNEGTVDGQATKTATYYHGATVVAPATDRTGYTFTGWSPALSTVATAAAEYDAQWAINEYTISFDTDGGSVMLPITQDYNTEITKPELPEKAGYVFAGWIDENGEAAEIPATMPAEDVNLTATWTLAEFNVSFYKDEALTAENLVSSVDYTYGLTINPPAVTRDGHTFAGWVDEATGKVVDFAAGVSAPARDVVYYAKWTPNTYAVTYRAQGGTFDDGSTQKVYNAVYGTASENVPVPVPPVREGYTFGGWNPATLPETITGQLNIVAKWTKNSYNAKFFAETTDKYAFDTVSVPFEDYITAPEDEPTKTGYVFAGWSTDGVNVIDDLGIMGTEEVEFYAVWTEATDVVYKVEHYYMGTDMKYPADATRVDTFNGTTNATVTATADTADNFTVDNEKSILSGTVAADGSLVLEVYYIREVNTLKIDVDGVVTEKEYPFEAPIDAVADPENKEGHTFAGWVDADGNPTTVPATMGADSEYIKASWTVNSYNVTFINEGATYDGPTATEYNTAIAVPSEPTKTGYTFAGWFDAEGKQVTDYTAMPAKNLEFTAKWTANGGVNYILEVYEMNFDGAYSETPSSTTTYDDGVVGEVKTAEYVAPVGFTLDTDKSELTGTIPTTGTLVLKAYIIRNIYTLYVDVDGVVTDTDYYYNEEVAAVADPVKDGYVFAGWVDAEGNAVTVPVVMPANDVTIYADWVEDTYKAVFNAGEGMYPDTGKNIVEVDVAYGADINAPATKPNRDGYEFLGWATTENETDASKAVAFPVEMPLNGETYYAIWSKTDYALTFYDYKPAEGGPNTPTVKYSYATSSKTIGDPITFPESPSFEHYVFLGWSETEGDSTNLIQPTDSITMPGEDYELYAIYEKVKIMLVPENDSCTTVIDRAGGTVDDYTADSQWYVYGLEEFLTETRLLDEYIDVTGDGRIEIVYMQNELGGTWAPYTGTGTIINVYDRMGTNETTDDVLVESFRIIIFGDVNGDSCAQAIDATYVYDETIGLTSWSNPYVPEEYKYYLVKAADIDGDTYITPIDGTYIGDHSIGTEFIDQVTGRLS